MASPSDVQNQIYISPLLLDVVNKQPSDLSPLQPTQFKFISHRTPETVYFCQKANLPGLTLGVASYDTPLGVSIPLPGTRYEFDSFEITFLVNEDMGNWLEINEWLRGLAPLSEDTGVLKHDQQFSDGSLILNNSNHQPMIEVVFYDMFPSQLSAIEFDSTLGEPEAVAATATFQYTHYDIKKIS